MCFRFKLCGDNLKFDKTCERIFIKLFKRKMKRRRNEKYLNHSGENISEGYEHKIVQSCGVGNLGQVLASLQAQEGHGQHCGDPCNTS